MSQRSAVVIGSGIMGRGIAALLVRAGCDTQMLARKPDKWQQIDRDVTNLAVQLESASAPGTLRPCATLDDIDWADCDIVIETVIEDQSVKKQVFRELDSRAAPNVPIATNTSGMRVTDIAGDCLTRNRMAHAHFFMPAHIVPLVELARAAFTSERTMDQMQNFFEAIGSVPVRINSDVPGLLANRIQHALTREALSVVDSGLASAEDVDKAVRFGFGFRYVAAGPILQKEFSGLDTLLASASAVYPSLCNDAVPARLLRDTVAAGHFGVKSGKGFREWPEREIKIEYTRYEKTLLDASKLLQRDIRSKG